MILPRDAKMSIVVIAFFRIVKANSRLGKLFYNQGRDPLSLMKKDLMAIQIKCKGCSELMPPTTALACPKCGYPNERAKYVPGRTVFLVFAITALLIWWMSRSW